MMWGKKLKNFHKNIILLPAIENRIIAKLVDIPASFCSDNLIDSISKKTFVPLSLAVVDVMTSKYPVLYVGDYKLLKGRDGVLHLETVCIPSKDVVLERCMDERFECLNELSVNELQSFNTVSTNIVKLVPTNSVDSTSSDIITTYLLSGIADSKNIDVDEGLINMSAEPE